MATDKQAAKFLTHSFNSVWNGYSTDALRQYYDKQFVAYLPDSSFNYEQTHEVIKVAPQRLSKTVPDFHHIMAVERDQISAWYTTRHFDLSNREVFRVNCIGHYHIRNDRIISVDLAWNTPFNDVLTQLVGNKKSTRTKLIPAPFNKLSQRELQCLFHLLQGKSAKIIGATLYISPRTVENHINNIKTKLNLPNIQALYELAYQSNLVKLSSLLSIII